jgi:hypothetical protein
MDVSDGEDITSTPQDQWTLQVLDSQFEFFIILHPVQMITGSLHPEGGKGF